MSAIGKDINQLAHNIKKGIRDMTDGDLIILGEFLTSHGFVCKGVGIDSKWEFDEESRHTIFTGKFEYLKGLFPVPNYFINGENDCG